MRKLAVLVAVCVMAVLFAPAVRAEVLPPVKVPDSDAGEPNPNLKLWGKPVDIHLNGEWIVKWQDALPFIQEDPPWRTMVPVRFISEKLGAKVEWVQEEKKAVIELGDKKIELWVGRNTAKVNGKEVELDASIWLQSEPAWRIFAPLRFVTECLGGKVEWTPPGGLSKSKEYPGQKIVIDEVVITYPAPAE
ncbi:MAG: copper amine oxidase N-terminal domain-containing protein [Bacillota bacterium]|nr:copper amine oxidase N-terminal domain-containing protein [Bacillota bacterium]